MNFYTEYYCCSSKKRQEEIDFVLKHTISLSFLHHVYIFTNNHDINNCNAIINSHNKVTVISSDQRKTFQDIFNFANSVSDISTINIVSNNDILLTHSFHNLNIADTDFYAISRFESMYHKCPFRYQESDSQDTWVWKGLNKITDANFYFGILGCDSALAFLAKQHYTITNPAFTYKSIHHHKSNFRTDSAEESRRIILPYIKVKAIHAKIKKTTL